MSDPVAADDWARAKFEWAIGTPRAELATELMGAFGPGGPIDSPIADFLDSAKLVDWLFMAHPRAGKAVRGQLSQLKRPIAEAVQLLEHAELVYLYLMWEFTTGGNGGWSATQLGLATLAKGKDAVRQRIKDRTGL
jgi:hypothetical protein